MSQLAIEPQLGSPNWYLSKKFHALGPITFCLSSNLVSCVPLSLESCIMSFNEFLSLVFFWHLEVLGLILNLFAEKELLRKYFTFHWNESSFYVHENWRFSKLAPHGLLRVSNSFLLYRPFSKVSDINAKFTRLMDSKLRLNGQEQSDIETDK